MDKEAPSVLRKIEPVKVKEVEALYKSGRARAYAREYVRSERDFWGAITHPGMNLIAEFKKASPSKGEIRPGAEPEEIARLYERCGAAAMSVLTDSHFNGKISYLARVREVVDIPLLRKDFIIDPAQIFEARYHGADAILLISAMLESSQMFDYIQIAGELGMDCLVESHNEWELEKSIEAGAEIFGINNRDLHTFKVNLDTTLNLLPHVPGDYPIVTESGIWTYDDVKYLSHPRVKAMLVGEAIMSKEKNPTLADMEAKIAELLQR